MALNFLKIAGATFLVSGIYYLAMQYADGPTGIIRGGSFKTGELVLSPTDWSFLRGREKIEFQAFEPDTSRVVWFAVLDGRLYIISGYMNTALGKIWKQWPGRLERDNRVVLRVDGKLYEQRLRRLMAHPLLVDLMGIYAEKYGIRFAKGDHNILQTALIDGDYWLYEVIRR